MIETIDLFEHYDELPHAVKEILESADEMKDSYAENDRMIEALKPLGYTFDYGLCGEPMDLKRIYNNELMLLVETEGYVRVVTTGIDMNCNKVICSGIVFKEDEKYIYQDSVDSIKVICDNLCDIYPINDENIKLVKDSII
tara:strand:+ start:2107 stop:2529 length:423 start_codon:yes stop_codon:yes gene_type:complete